MSAISQPKGILKRAGETSLSFGSVDKKLGRRESKVTLNEPSKKGAIPENAIKEAKQVKAPRTKTAVIKREVPIVMQTFIFSLSPGPFQLQNPTRKKLQRSPFTIYRPSKGKLK